MDGVEDADVSYETGTAVVTFDPALTTPEAFIAELTRLTGFTAEVTADGDQEVTADGDQSEERLEQGEDQSHSERP